MKRKVTNKNRLPCPKGLTPVQSPTYSPSNNLYHTPIPHTNGTQFPSLKLCHGVRRSPIATRRLHLAECIATNPAKEISVYVGNPPQEEERELPRTMVGRYLDRRFAVISAKASPAPLFLFSFFTFCLLAAGTHCVRAVSFP